MVVSVGLPDVADSVERGFVADMTSECVARIGGVNDDAATTQRGDRLPDEANLWRDRMQL